MAAFFLMRVNESQSIRGSTKFHKYITQEYVTWFAGGTSGVSVNGIVVTRSSGIV